MKPITATALRKKLFEILDKVARGESVVIIRNGAEVGRIVPTEKPDWRMNLSEEAELLVSEKDAFAPLDDVWEGYL